MADHSCCPWHPERWKSVVYRDSKAKGAWACVSSHAHQEFLALFIYFKNVKWFLDSGPSRSNPQTSGNETQQNDHRSVEEKCKLFTYSYSFKACDLFQFPCFYMHIMKFTNCELWTELCNSCIIDLLLTLRIVLFTTVRNRHFSLHLGLSLYWICF